MTGYPTPRVPIGQAVRYTGDMANAAGIGAVIAVRDGRYPSYDVALTDGRQHNGSMLDASRYQIIPQILDADQLNLLRSAVAAKTAMDNAKQTSAAQAFEQEKARIAGAYPYLIRGNGHVIAAKNIRAELKRAFPSVKFSVTSESYAGGNAVRIGWTDGPMAQQVEAFADKYSGGSFDGMTDCYNYSHSPWTEVFGKAKYITCNRHYSPKMIETVMGRVCRTLGGMDTLPTVEDFQQGRLWNFPQSGGCDVGREVNKALAKHTYCLTRGAQS